MRDGAVRRGLAVAWSVLCDAAIVLAGRARTLTQRMVEFAGAHCGGQLVSVLEGGYDLEALAASVEAHVAVLRAGA